MNIEIDFAVMKCEGSEFHNVLARYSNVFVPLDLLFGDGNCNNVGFLRFFSRCFGLNRFHINSGFVRCSDLNTSHIKSRIFFK